MTATLGLHETLLHMEEQFQHIATSGLACIPISIHLLKIALVLYISSATTQMAPTIMERASFNTITLKILYLKL